MTVHKGGRQYGCAVILAGTPNSWPDGPSLSTLNVLLIFVGIPLLVILAVSVLVFMPGWMKGPRYRPGQSWDATSEWFGVAGTARRPAEVSSWATPTDGVASAGGATAAGVREDVGGATAAGVGGSTTAAPPEASARPVPETGGASAAW